MSGYVAGPSDRFHVARQGDSPVTPQDVSRCTAARSAVSETRGYAVVMAQPTIRFFVCAHPDRADQNFEKSMTAKSRNGVFE
jgi:hypothetical protein